ncbi:MAG: general secretion pathway protein GspB [Immundisolibacteraceae bacterium]|nr:general secretion pathway protein GspB [Immundisolibacteraceae bacterium]
MSYILEAMRKSERDATMGQPINLPNQATPPIRRLLFPTLALLIVMVIGIGIWFGANSLGLLPWQSSTPSIAAAPDPAPSPASKRQTAAITQSPHHQTIEVTLDRDPVIEESPVVAPVTIMTQNQKVTIARATSWQELPDMSQFINQLPENLLRLRIGIHVYDQTASRRFLLVNGRRYQQGDELVDDARISEITPDGIAIEYRGLHFHKPR